MKKRSGVNIPVDQISPLRLGKLKGRLLRIAAANPADSRKKIVLIYGHHSTLERWYLMARWLAGYGEVYVPDIPGFGGMTSFYKSGLKQPTLEDFADYLYTFLKAYKLTRDVRLIGMSFGGSIVTRMLQRHPETHQWLDKVINLVPFTGVKEVHLKPIDHFLLRNLSRFGASPFGSRFLKIVAYNRFSSYVMVKIFMRYKKKMKAASREEADKILGMEMDLWQKNDVRTHGTTGYWMLSQTVIHDTETKLPMTVHAVVTGNDQYFDPDKVIESMQRIFQQVVRHDLDSATHAPSVVGSVAEIEQSMPDSIKAVLRT